MEHGELTAFRDIDRMVSRIELNPAKPETRFAGGKNRNELERAGMKHRPPCCFSNRARVVYLAIQAL